MRAITVLSAAVALTGPALAITDVSTLPSRLKAISADIFPPLKAIAVDIWNNPELGRSEHHAHDLIVDHFTQQNRQGGQQWNITPHAYGMPTAFRLEFEHRPGGTPPDKALPAIGFLAEYDALPGIGHACGHNHIGLVALAAAEMVRRVVVELGIAVRVVVVGTPDEEGEAGKYELLRAGAFDDGGKVEVWFLAHPTSASAVQPMNARINVVGEYRAEGHEEVVRKAYEALVGVRDLVLAGSLPGTASSVTPVEDVGMFASNVVQGQISLGINGTGLDRVRETVDAILDSSYPGVSYTAALDDAIPGGVNLTVFGPGGHASENTKSPLVLTIETFRALTSSQEAGGNISFYLPGNTTCSALDITFNLRSRYTRDLDAVVHAVSSVIQSRASRIRTDTVYPALEVTPALPEIFLDLVKQPEYFGPSAEESWHLSTFAPASTDAAWLQNAVLDAKTHALVGADRVVFHPNYSICKQGGICAFNHEPGFRDVAGTEYSYRQTEVVARALAHVAVQLLGDKGAMANVTAILR